MNQGYVFECLNFCTGAEAAARPRLREQRLRRVHAVPLGDRRRDPRARRGDGRARRDGRRHERLDRSRRRGARDRPRPRGRTAPRSSRRSRTASSGTRAATPAPTARRASSTTGGTRDPIVVLRAQLEEEGVDAVAPRRARARGGGRARADARAGPRRTVPDRARRPASSRTEGRRGPRADDAEAVRLDGRRGHHPLAEGAGRGVRARRGADRGRDGQGDRRLRGRGRRDARRRSSSPRARRPASGEPIATLSSGDGETSGEATPSPPATPSARRRSRRRRTPPTATRRLAPERDAGGEASRGRARRLAPRHRRHRARAAGSRVEDVRAAAGSASRRARAVGDAAGKGEVTTRRADADAGDDRPPDGASRRPTTPVLHRLGRRRRVADRRAAPRRARGRRARSPSLNDFVVKAAARDAARAPAVQRVVRRRAHRVLLARQRRHRGCDRRRAARARRARRRPEAARRDRRRDAAPRRRGARPALRPDELRDGDVHGLEPRACSACARSPRSSTRRRRRSSPSAAPGARRSRTAPDGIGFRDVMTLTLTLRPPRRLRRRRRALPVPLPRAARAAARARPLMPTTRTHDDHDFRTAIRDALDEELADDERVILFGEDVAVAGGVFATTTGPPREVRPASASSTRRSPSSRSPAPRSARR